MYEESFDLPYGSEWSYPTEYPTEHIIHNHIFIIQNTHIIKKARENILTFLAEHNYNSGISGVESFFSEYILFDKQAYTYPNVESKRNEEEELQEEQIGIQQEETNFSEIDDIIAYIGEDNSECLGIFINEDAVNDTPPYPKSFEKAFNCSFETKYSAGLETISTLLGPIEDLKNKKSYGPVHFTYHYFIGDGNDSMNDKIEVLEKIILYNRTNTFNSYFYAVGTDGKLEYVGNGLEGAVKLFNIIPEEVTNAKESLAAQFPDYASVWKEEQRKEKIRIYDEYLKEYKQRVKGIKALILSYGAINLCPKNPNQFTMGGIQYTEINDFLNSQYLSWNDFGYSPANTCRKYWLQQNANGQIMLVKNERYPCFDSYDYANEDRYYTTCILCDNIEDAYKKSSILAFEGLGTGIPELMGQVLYYDSGESYLATSKSAKIDDKDRLFSRILQAIEEFNLFKRNAPESPYH